MIRALAFMFLEGMVPIQAERSRQGRHEAYLETRLPCATVLQRVNRRRRGTTLLRSPKEPRGSRSSVAEGTSHSNSQRTDKRRECQETGHRVRVCINNAKMRAGKTPLI